MNKENQAPRIFLIKEEGYDHREKRIIEEFNKKNVQPEILNIFGLCILSDGVFYKNERINFNPNDVFWSISNSAIIKKVTSCPLLKDKFMWPNPQVNFFSDKFLGNCFFSQNGIDTPKTGLINKYDINDLAQSVGGFPCVIKRTNGSKGSEVSIVNSEKDAIRFMKSIYDKKLGSFGKWKDDFCFIFQEYIKESSGFDFRILCLEDEIIGGIKRTSRNGDFRANVSLGGEASTFDIPYDLIEICHKIMKKGGLFYAGLDFIKSNRGWLAIEVNTCAQFEGFERATGINVSSKIVDKLIEKARIK